VVRRWNRRTVAAPWSGLNRPGPRCNRFGIWRKIGTLTSPVGTYRLCCSVVATVSSVFSANVLMEHIDFLFHCPIVWMNTWKTWNSLKKRESALSKRHRIPMPTSILHKPPLYCKIPRASTLGRSTFYIPTSSKFKTTYFKHFIPVDPITPKEAAKASASTRKLKPFSNLIRIRSFYH
jgi:hypothetical protein